MAFGRDRRDGLDQLYDGLLHLEMLGKWWSERGIERQVLLGLLLEEFPDNKLRL